MIPIDPRAELIVFGALMTLVAVWLPDGIAGAVAGLATRVIRPGRSR
jgi:ABC-type branched-subunit amino acid transport system permease subunit